MRRRLQAILDDPELLEIQRAARRERLTTAEWVRRAPRTDVKKKLAVVRAAAAHGFPTGNIDVMLEEIDRGFDSLPGLTRLGH